VRPTRAVAAIPWMIMAAALMATALVVAEVVWPTTGASPGGGGPARVEGPGPGGSPARSPGQSLASPATSATVTGTSARGGSRSPRWVAFATVRGISLYLPAPHPVAVAYHEAALDLALDLHPVGHLIHNYNRFKYRSSGASAGPGYVVMSSRGRSAPATSAADIVLRPGTPVRAPVTGRVVGLQTYRLYCRYPDVRVAIVPATRPDVRVVAIHLAGVRVRRGDRVFATLSVIGRPRVFPFRSQVDDYFHGGNPHVHIEVEKPSPTPVPTCPSRHRPRPRR